MRNFKSVSVLTAAIVSAAIAFSMAACTKEGPAMGPGMGPGMGAPGPYGIRAVCANNPPLQKFGCAMEKITVAARAGDPDAEYALGYLYFYGIGVAPDPRTGMMWINKAAAHGQPLARKALVSMKRGGGPGVPPPGMRHVRETTNAERLNATKHSESISHHLPNYGKAKNHPEQTGVYAPPSASGNVSQPAATQPMASPPAVQSSTTTTTTTTAPASTMQQPPQQVPVNNTNQPQ